MRCNPSSIASKDDAYEKRTCCPSPATADPNQPFLYEALVCPSESKEYRMFVTAQLNEKTPVQAQFVPWMDAYRVPEGTDILVNATSIGLYPDVDDVPAVDMATVGPGLLVCDVIPNPPHTQFLQAAETRGAVTLNGLGMLVYQGAIAFKLWTGLEPDVKVMREALQRFFAVPS